jgi:hypothetical protein
MKLLLIFALVYCACNIISAVDVKVTCTDAGECIRCSQDELNEDYCKESGKKMKVLCSGKGVGIKQDDYRSCYLTAGDEQLRVLLFQVAMAIIGGLAYWGVQSRKQLNMTLFEHRKQRHHQ